MRLVSFARLICLTSLAVAVIACTKTNTNDYTDASVPTDAEFDARMGCITNPSICVEPDSTCVNDQCADCAMANDRESADCNVAGSPVCGVGNVCRACSDGDECDSGVCEAGACIATADVVYVEQGLADNPNCSMAMPCGSPSHGMTLIAGTRRHLHIEGSSTAYDVDPLTISTDVSIHADGAILSRNSGNQVIDISAATVSIDGMTVREATGGGNADGIKCTGATLRLRRMQILENDDRGLDATNCILDVSQSVFAGNLVGALRVVDGRATIRNNFVFDNGSNSATAGGLSLNPDAVPNLVEFNTIVKNKAADNATSAGGIFCASGSADIIARNNVVYESVMTNEVVGATCAHSFSVIGSANPPSGTMVVSMSRTQLGLSNLDGTTLDAYRPTSVSMLRGAADPAPSPAAAAIDFDGEARPNGGAAADIGADEVP